MNLTIYLTNGNTLRFEKVENLTFTGSSIEFNYTSASQNTIQEGVFYKDTIAGFSHTKAN